MPRRTPQWYETEDGKPRLALELEAIERFNAPRRADLRITGSRHRQGHLLLRFGFQPLPARPLVVRAELILSSRHPQLEPAARIVEPALEYAPHLVDGGLMRHIAHKRTIPSDWVEEGPILCMYRHGGGQDAWSPAMTAVSAVLNVQGWFANYLLHTSTGRWRYDEAPAARRAARPA